MTALFTATFPLEKSQGLKSSKTIFFITFLFPFTIALSFFSKSFIFSYSYFLYAEISFIFKNMVNLMKTLLAIGDKKDFDSFMKFFRQRKLFKKHGFSFKSIDYDSVLEGRLPKIKTKHLIVFLFFPFNYWEKNIETKKSKEVYGNKGYFPKFKKFWKEIDKTLKDFYKDKKIHFINSPDKSYAGRDKETTKSILAKAGIPISRHHFTRDYKKIIEMVDNGKKLFIKVRCGSMGKGMTYLEKDRWLTNFRFKNNKIVSKKSDYGWTFKDITYNKKFLKELMRQDIIIEDAINPFLLKGRMFDLRMYVGFGKVLYIYPRSNECETITTNISQGARGENSRFVHGIPPKILDKAIKNAVRTVKAMNLNFAGVDIMPNNGYNKVTVIEVNSFPGFPKVRKFNLAKHLIKEIVKQKWE